MGAAFALVLALGLISLGGARTDRQTQVPAALDRGHHRVPDHGTVQRAASAADHLVPLVATLPAAASVAFAAVSIFLLSAAAPRAQAPRPVPATGGRGPPVRLLR
ncbi:hypothetical protein BH10ACT1_BH10ACT1_38630 [soil metagenome]